MRASWVEVDRAALRDNLRGLRAALSPGCDLMLVVKADAYGHGAPAVAALATAAGVKRLAVAHVDETPPVRRSAPTSQILVLGPILPAEVGVALRERATVVVVDTEHGRALAAEARRRRRVLPTHLKIDTGMGRIGFAWQDAVDAIRPLFHEPGLRIEGICTHFARVEAGEGDPARAQVERFLAVADAADSFAGRRLFRHMSASRGMQLHPEWDSDCVRIGIAAYGYGASDPAGRVVTRPVLQWKSRVAQVRRVPAGSPVGYYGVYVTPAATTLAVIAVGYADGYLRALSNRSHVLINGRRCRVVGRISMNWMVADAGLYATVAAGDEAVLIGRQGNQEIWADEMAALCRTIPYEILTGIRATIERRMI